MIPPIDLIRSLRGWLSTPVPLEAGTTHCFGDSFLLLVPTNAPGQPLAWMNRLLYPPGRARARLSIVPPPEAS